MIRQRVRKDLSLIRYLIGRRSSIPRFASVRWECSVFLSGYPDFPGDRMWVFAFVPESGLERVKGSWQPRHSVLFQVSHVGESLRIQYPRITRRPVATRFGPIQSSTSDVSAFAWIRLEAKRSILGFLGGKQMPARSQMDAKRESESNSNLVPQFPASVSRDTLLRERSPSLTTHRSPI